ncbi:MAG: carbon storage regulator [Planctomycetia bacterium]|nr:carbon storage regulator [Planctomycetia bacterium]
MLVLTRKNRESVVIGQPGEMRIALEITILEIEGGRVRIGFEADTKLPIHRREVWDRICNGQGNGQGNGNGNGNGNGDGAGNGDGNGKADGQPLAAALARMEGRRQAGG